MDGGTPPHKKKSIIWPEQLIYIFSDFKDRAKDVGNYPSLSVHIKYLYQI